LSSRTSIPGNFFFRTGMNLTYFSGQPADVDRDLTAEEVVELQSLLSELYTAIFRADPVMAPTFRTFNATIIGTPVYTPGAVINVGPPSIAFPFDSNFNFAPETSVTSPQVLKTMVGVDYQTFITAYLRRNPPNNQLDRVQQVLFSSSTGPTARSFGN
jgi:hypothetical protein